MFHAAVCHFMKHRQHKTTCLLWQPDHWTVVLCLGSLIQAGLGCLHIQDYSLSQDLLKIFRVGQRVTKCEELLCLWCINLRLLSLMQSAQPSVMSLPHVIELSARTLKIRLVLILMGCFTPTDPNSGFVECWVWLLYMVWWVCVWLSQAWWSCSGWVWTTQDCCTPFICARPSRPDCGQTPSM